MVLIWIYRDAPQDPNKNPFAPRGIPYNDQGYTAYITGGNTKEGGNDALRGLKWTIEACRAEGIPIKGYVAAPNVGVDNKGNIYWTTPGGGYPLEGYAP
jgi:hypothetical protein